MKNLRAQFALFVLALTFCVSPAARPQASAGAVESASSPQLVIIDTDIGDDIDDAFALALALKSPELKVLGVTTTFGNTEMRARLLDRYLQAVGRSDIPVFAGPDDEDGQPDDAGGICTTRTGEEIRRWRGVH